MQPNVPRLPSEPATVPQPDPPTTPQPVEGAPAAAVSSMHDRPTTPHDGPVVVQAPNPLPSTPPASAATIPTKWGHYEILAEIAVGGMGVVYRARDTDLKRPVALKMIRPGILGNPEMIKAYQDGAPGNGKAFPDGAKMAKVHWTPKPSEFFPEASVPGKLVNVDFMVKDSKRFADSGGWGYAVFDYDAASDSFTPGTTAGKPPQGNDAKCGFACHTTAKARDYVFTDYGKR